MYSRQYVQYVTTATIEFAETGWKAHRVIKANTCSGTVGCSGFIFSDYYHVRETATLDAGGGVSDIKTVGGTRGLSAASASPTATPSPASSPMLSNYTPIGIIFGPPPTTLNGHYPSQTRQLLPIRHHSRHGIRVGRAEPADSDAEQDVGLVAYVGRDEEG